MTFSTEKRLYLLITANADGFVSVAALKTVNFG